MNPTLELVVSKANGGTGLAVNKSFSISTNETEKSILRCSECTEENSASYYSRQGLSSQCDLVGLLARL